MDAQEVIHREARLAGNRSLDLSDHAVQFLLEHRWRKVDLRLFHDGLHDLARVLPILLCLGCLTELIPDTLLQLLKRVEGADGPCQVIIQFRDDLVVDIVDRNAKLGLQPAIRLLREIGRQRQPERSLLARSDAQYGLSEAWDGIGAACLQDHVESISLENLSAIIGDGDEVEREAIIPRGRTFDGLEYGVVLADLFEGFLHLVLGRPDAFGLLPVAPVATQVDRRVQRDRESVGDRV